MGDGKFVTCCVTKEVAMSEGNRLRQTLNDGERWIHFHVSYRANLSFPSYVV